METYHYRISLRLRHPSMESRALSEAVGLLPSRTIEPGEPRVPGVSEGTYWVSTLREGAWPPVSLSDAIAASLDQLSTTRSFLHQLRSEGGSAELFIGWFFNGQSGDVLDCRLLARTADLAVDLSFDVYA